MRWFSAWLGSLLLAVPASAAIAPRYDIKLSLDPQASSFAVSLNATGLACVGTRARLYLNRAITITAATVDGRPVQPELDPAGAPTFWISRDRAIDLPCPTERLTLDYRGPGDQLTADGRNQVSPALVELSLYGGWFPLQAIDVLPRWTLTTRLPPGWRWASNGQGADDGLLKLRSAKPADVVLLAAPRFEDVVARSGVIRARLLLPFPAVPADRTTMVQIGAAGADMARWLTGVLGPAKGALRPVIVFPPRGGSLSYARLPLVVLSRDSLRPGRDRPPSLNIRHEIAHFWSTAPAASDQWIGEGIAEYLAVRRTIALNGNAEGLLASYRRKVAEAGPAAIIANSQTDGPAGFSARYARPVLLFHRLTQRNGWPKVALLLRRAYALGDQLTTERLLDLTATTLGKDNRQLFEQCLRAPDWPEQCGGSGPKSGD
jgi:hypothetical protein